MQTKHYTKVKEFMEKAGHVVNNTPTIPDENTRLLRAKLILEETLETIAALGCEVSCRCKIIDMNSINIEVVSEGDMVGVADGVADISVVTVGTLVSYGINDEKLLDLVDDNNLAKFGPGHSFRADGKLIKPADHQAPDIQGLLNEQV